MKLSDRQIRIVNAFLRDHTAGADGMAASAKTEIVTRIRRHVRDELARRTDATLQDEELIRLLNRIQFPERAALADAAAVAVSNPAANPRESGDIATPRATDGDPEKLSLGSARGREAKPRSGVAISLSGSGKAVPPSGPLASTQRIWLGVCLALADRFGSATARWRAGFIVLGALTGPFAVVLYLSLYTEMYLGRYGRGAPRIDRRRLVRSVGESASALMVFAMLATALVYVIDKIHAGVVGFPPNLDEWGEFGASYGWAIFATALVVIPFSALAGLPLLPPWDTALPKAVRTALAVVAGLLSLGFASYLAGALVSAAQNGLG